jgi:putative transposase
MLPSTKIRLQISEADAQTLKFMQAKCRGLYNWWVLRLRAGARWPGWAEAKATLEASKQYDPELCFGYGKLLQEVYFRPDRAMATFFRRTQAGKTPGFPRVPPRHGFFTLCHPAMYVKVEGNRIHLPTGGDRDVNSAVNILRRFLARLGPYTCSLAWLERAVCCA